MDHLSAVWRWQRSFPGTGWDLSSQFHRSSFMWSGLKGKLSDKCAAFASNMK